METFKKVVLALVVVLLGFSPSISANFELVEMDGWQLGARARLAISCSITDASAQNDGLYGSEGTNTTCGVGRTLLPSEVGLWGNTPEWLTPLGKVQVDGVIDLAYTVNFHESDSSGTEIRNGFMKIKLTPNDSGAWSLTLGNQLPSFADVILLDHTLQGVGVPSGPETVDTTGLGHIGTGYLFDLGFSFGAKLETATFHGVNLELGVYNPSSIPGLSSSPRYEGQLNYVHHFDEEADIKAWVTALYQENQYQKHDVDILGFDAGIAVNKGPYGILVYGYHGEGIGSILLNKFISEVDAEAFGGMAQLHYKTALLSKPTKLALSYGISAIDTEIDGTIKSREAIIGGIYLDVNEHVNLFVEGGHAWSEVVGSSDAANNFGNLGFNLNF